MSTFCIMRTQKYKTNYSINKVIKHNLRDEKSVIKGQIANPKYPNVYEGASSSKELFTQMMSRIKKCTSNPRPDANKIVEVVITATDTFFNSNDKSVHEAYFMKAKEWVEKHYGKENVLQTAIHYDEKTPHMHVLIVPIKTELHKKTGKEVTKLNAKAFFDGPKSGIALQDDFYKDVGKPFDLDRGISKSITGAEHITTNEFWRNIADHLAATAANELTSSIEKQRYEQLAIDATAIKVEVENLTKTYKDKLAFHQNDIKAHDAKKQKLIKDEAEFAKEKNRILNLDKELISKERDIKKKEEDLTTRNNELLKKEKEVQANLDESTNLYHMSQKLYASLSPDEQDRYRSENSELMTYFNTQVSYDEKEIQQTQPSMESLGLM